jgi:hypothetical protein
MPLPSGSHLGPYTISSPIASFVSYPYAVTKDGQRFLINTTMPTPFPVTVVSDWTLALKK